MRIHHALALGAALLTLAGCGEVVDAGNRGVRVHLGQVDQESLKEGFYFYNPFTTSIHEVSAKTKLEKSQTQAFTLDLQQATVQYAVRFHPAPESIPFLFQKYGQDQYADVLIPPAALSSIKNVFGKFRAPEAVSRRGEIEQAIQANLAEVLIKNHVVLEGFDILDIAVQKDYADAVGAKEVATQNAAAEVNRTVQVREQSSQKVIAAEAESKAIQLRATAVAQNPKIVPYEWVNKWDGKMPDTVYCTSSTPCVQTGN